jgi:hypothetical protein
MSGVSPFNVIPAKAGISGQEDAGVPVRRLGKKGLTAGRPETPAFAGVTTTGAGA